jgi:peptide deformylase
VIRATHIKLKAQDPEGNPLEYEMEGFEARAVQHELDHLDGMLFVDRVVSRRTDLFRRKIYQKGKKPKA